MFILFDMWIDIGPVIETYLGIALLFFLLTS